MNDPLDAPQNLGAALRQRARGPAVLWIAITLLALVGWDLFPEQFFQLSRAYLLVSAALVTWAASRALTAAYPTWGRTGFDAALQPRRSPVHLPEELEAVQRTVAFAKYTALDTDARLRPLLREIADAQLAARYGGGLDIDLQTARERLGERVWEAVHEREGRPDWDAPGMDLRQLAEVVTALERVAER